MRLAIACLLVTPGCFMTADENLWKQTDAAPDVVVIDAQRDAPDPMDARRDGASDITLEGPAESSAPDLPRPDLPVSDLPIPDLPIPDAACGQMVLKVSVAENDGEISGGFLPDGESWDNDVLYIGFWGTNTITWGYFRFKLTDKLPQGSKVTNTTLDLWGVKVAKWQPSTMAVAIYAEDSADAPSTTKADDAPSKPSGRDVVTTNVRWPAAGGLAWQTNQYNTTPDLSPLIQLLVNTHSGLAVGSHVQLWLRGAQQAEGEVGTNQFKMPSYSSHPATLTVNWCL